MSYLPNKNTQVGLSAVEGIICIYEIYTHKKLDMVVFCLGI